MAGKPKKKTCFVVGPIGDDESEDRIHADWLLEDIIEPVFDQHFPEFLVTRADKISNPGQITSQVITALLESDLVIADLTTLNPNAFYEIGIRHTVQKPIIHMHLEGQRIPFDIAPFRSVKFSRQRPKDIKAARAVLEEFIREATSTEHQVDNPVTFSRGKIEFEKSATPAEKVVQDQMTAILDRMRFLEDAVQRDTIFGLERMSGHGVSRTKQRFPVKADVVQIKAMGITSTRQIGKMIIDVVPKYFPAIHILSEGEDGVAFSITKNEKNRMLVDELGKDLRDKYRDVKVTFTTDA
ncbi:hypothetical protein ACQZ5N_25875 [Agrobacterium sp. 22-221-1]